MATERPLLFRLADAFRWMEDRGLRVRQIWLSQEDEKELVASDESFDRERDRKVRMAVNRSAGGDFIGYLWGAYVSTSKHVPPGHVAMAQDGLDAKIFHGSASFKI